MPKKPVEMCRVPLNVLVAPATRVEILQRAKAEDKSQGEVIDSAFLFGSYLITPSRAVDVLQWRKDRKPLLKPSERK